MAGTSKLDGKQIPLGPDNKAAEAKFHALMAERAKGKPIDREDDDLRAIDVLNPRRRAGQGRPRRD